MIGRTPRSSRNRTKVDTDPGLVSRLVKATPLSDSTMAGAPYSAHACPMAVIAAAAVSAAAAWQATRVRVQSLRRLARTPAQPAP